MVRLLWDPLPDTLSAPRRRRFPWLRDLAAAMTASAPPMSEQERVNHRVRRGAIQALVREAYRATVAEQDSEHHPRLPLPRRGMLTWQACLIRTVSSCWLVAYRDHRRRHRSGLAAVRAGQPRLAGRDRARGSGPRPGQSSAASRCRFEVSIVSDGSSLGDVTYGICRSCRVGLLYKIGFPDDWQFCGLGRLALSQLEARHPDLTWYTTGQSRHARGFYDRYRQGSGSPWTVRQRPCPHFD